MNFPDIARAQWQRAWAALPAPPLRALADTIATTHRVEDVTLAQSGLGLLPLTDTALGDTYFLGEVPLVQAHVRLTAANGEQAEGAALMLDDRVGVARAIAILDAALSGGLDGHEHARALLQQGWSVIEHGARQRRALLASTRVDFSVLGSADGEDDDA